MVLGSGPAVPLGGRMASGYALVAPSGEVLQLECGPGSSRRWPEHGIGFHCLSGLLVTHRHLDHCAELPYLRFVRRLDEAGRARTVLVAGPAGHRTHWRALEALYGRDVAERSGEWDVRDLVDGDRLRVGPFDVWVREVRHVEGALGIRVDCGRRSLAFSGDSGPCDALVELCRGVDLALLECSHPAGRESERHLSAHTAAHIATRAGVRRLALTHLGPETRGHDVASQVRAEGYTGPLHLVRDGDVLPL